MPMHPIEPFLLVKLSELESLWVIVRYPQPCPETRCQYSSHVPVTLLLSERAALKEITLKALLRSIVCRKCRKRPRTLSLNERGDGLGWTLEVPPVIWRRPFSPP
jgi:hypothetical protein